jgi:hypothetical protein
VPNPTEGEFHLLFKELADKFGIVYKKEVVDYLITSYYKKHERPLRFCQPRDILLQIRNYCTYNKVALEMTNEYIDRAVENYFSVM